MSSIGLISNNTYWDSTRGVVTKVTVDLDQALVYIRIHGIVVPVITVNGDDEAINKFAVHQWLDNSNVLSEWYEEAARYRSALERVDLPCKFTMVPSTCLPSEREDKFLTYKLHMVQDGYSIHLTVVVEHNKATVSIVLGQGDNWYKKVDIGEGALTGLVNVDTIKKVVRSALDNFISRLNRLVEQPIVEAVPYS